MSLGNAVGSDGTPLGSLKMFRDKGEEWLTNLFNNVLENKKMPGEWSIIIVVPVYESKGDIQTIEIGAELNYWVIQWDYGKELIERILRVKSNIYSYFEFREGQL